LALEMLLIRVADVVAVLAAGADRIGASDQPDLNENSVVPKPGIEPG
jgi:hypothetical protein